MLIHSHKLIKGKLIYYIKQYVCLSTGELKYSCAVSIMATAIIKTPAIAATTRTIASTLSHCDWQLSLAH